MADEVQYNESTGKVKVHQKINKASQFALGAGMSALGGGVAGWPNPLGGISIPQGAAAFAGVILPDNSPLLTRVQFTDPLGPANIYKFTDTGAGVTEDWRKLSNPYTDIFLGGSNNYIFIDDDIAAWPDTTENFEVIDSDGNTISKIRTFGNVEADPRGQPVGGFLTADNNILIRHNFADATFKALQHRALPDGSLNWENVPSVTVAGLTFDSAGDFFILTSGGSGLKKIDKSDGSELDSGPFSFPQNPGDIEMYDDDFLWVGSALPGGSFGDIASIYTSGLAFVTGIGGLPTRPPPELLRFSEGDVLAISDTHVKRLHFDGDVTINQEWISGLIGSGTNNIVQGTSKYGKNTVLLDNDENVVGVDDPRLTTKNKVVKLNKTTGNTIWSTDFGADANVVAIGVRSDNDVIVAANPTEDNFSHLYRLDAGDGSIVWEKELCRFNNLVVDSEDKIITIGSTCDLIIA